MEIIRGKHTSYWDTPMLKAWLDGSEQVHLDLGTGDGRYAAHLARNCSRHRVIGLDASRENLRAGSRQAPTNALFVIANALALPVELDGQVTGISINFPWGSLLQGLLIPDSGLLIGLRRMVRPGAVIDLRLNGGALAEWGWSLEEGAIRVGETVYKAGLRCSRPQALEAAALRQFPSSWGKRLAYGRDPRAVWLRGTFS